MGVAEPRRYAAGEEHRADALALARADLHAQQRREERRQAVVLRTYLVAGVVVSCYDLVHFLVLDDQTQRLLAVLAAAMAAAFGGAIAFEASGRRAIAGVLAQLVPVVPVVAFSAVFSVEAGYTSLLFVSALGAVVTIPPEHARTRFTVIGVVMLSLLGIQVFLSRAHAIAPLDPDATSRVATVNRELMTVALFTLALVMTRGVQTARRLVDASLAVAELAANTDPLTGLPNRRPVWHRVEELGSSGRSFSLALIDIDHFKRLNDEFGHDCGDESLRHVAETLAQNARPTDLVGRWGGEEFVVVMEGEGADAVAAAERLRGRIAALAPYCGVAEHPVTVSIGVASGLGGADPLTVLRRADAALYEAKEAGRNRVVVAAA